MIDTVHRRNLSRTLYISGLIIAVGLIALILRLWFVLEISKIEIIWDSTDYWSVMQLVRNRICDTLNYCTPDPGISTTTPFSSLIRDVLFERLGIMPFLMGIALTILRVEPLSIYIVYAVVGSLICLMIVGILLRLGCPLWVALLGGIIHASYVPAITGEGAVLQQPFIRLCLALAAFAYVFAFTSRRRLFIWLCVTAAMVASVLVGFASITTRPLMLLIPASALLLTWRGARPVFIAQFVYLALLIAALIAATLLLTALGQEMLDSGARLITGLGAEGDSISSATTIATFPQIWAPSEWWRDFPGGALGSDFSRDPALFVNRLVYSVFANWRYPDYFYLQHFILTLEQQKVQHVLMVISGIAGIAWLLGQPGVHRRTALLILIIALYVSVSSSVISMEPRRLSVLSPFLAIGAAVFIGSIVTSIRSYPRTLVFDGLSAALCILVWWLPLPLVLEFARVEPRLAFIALITARVVLTAIVLWQLLQFWRRNQPQFGKWWAGAPLLAGLALLTFVSFQDTEWRSWQVTTNRVGQSIGQPQRREHLFPWLLIDLEQPEQAQELSIYLNDRLLKPEGEAMFAWEAGVPPTWSAFSRLLDIATTPPPRHLWLAYPIPPERLADGYIGIELRTGQTPITLRGDYTDVSSNTYIGPAFDPWHSGLSFWRWQWNATDPRIPAEQSLDGQFYRSSYFDGSEWVYGDLSPEYGHVEGLYRIFVTWAAFGENTNAVAQTHIPIERTPTCPEGDLLAAAPTGSQFACLQTDGDVAYFVDDVALGVSPGDVLEDVSEVNQVIDVHRTDRGYVEVLQVLKTVFVANFYRDDGEAVYSLAFTTY